MNIYKSQQLLQHHAGGYKCPCCNNNGKNGGKNGKKIDRRKIRRKIKSEDRKTIW